MKKCKVSVIVPTFNSEKSIDTALKSVLSQTLEDIEVICIDDASQDATLSKLKDYRDNCSKIKLFSFQKNCGVSVARNHGINVAKGDYLFFLDSDDCIYDQTALSRLYEKAVQKNANVCGGNCLFFNRQENRIFQPTSPEYVFQKEGFIEYKNYQFHYGFWRFLYKRSFLVENELFFPDLRRYQDPPFMISTLNRAGFFYVIPSIVYRYTAGRKTICSESVYDQILKGINMSLELSRQNNLEILTRKLIKQKIILRTSKFLVDMGVSEQFLRKIWEIKNLGVNTEKV